MVLTIPYGLCFCILLKSITAHSTRPDNSDEHKLYQLLLSGYNKFIRPVTNINHTIHVKTNPALNDVMDTDEAAETITVKQWMRLDWTDEFLHWNPDEYNGLKEIMVPLSQIWMPDLIIYGMVDVWMSIPEEKTLAHIGYLGNISISIMQSVKLHCSFNVASFPFDTQNCSFHFASWQYNYKQLHWETLKPHGDTKHFQPHTEWSLVSYDASNVLNFYPNIPVPYTEVYYHLVLRRKPQYYIFTMILPSFVITTLSIVGLFTPFSAGEERQEKISLALTTLLAMAVLLIMIADQMPKTSVGLPMIGVFLLFELMVTTVSCLFAVGIMYIHHLSAYGHTVPNRLRKLAFLPIKVPPNKSSQKPFQDKRKISCNDPGLALQLKQCNMQMQEIRKHLENMEEDSARLMEWMRVCDRLDFFMLILMLVVNTVFSFGIYVFVKLI